MEKKLSDQIYTAMSEFYRQQNLNEIRAKEVLTYLREIKAGKDVSTWSIDQLIRNLEIITGDH